MWLLVSIMAVLWFLSVCLYFPVVLTFAFLAAMLVLAATAVVQTPTPRQ